MDSIPGVHRRETEENYRRAFLRLMELIAPEKVREAFRSPAVQTIASSLTLPIQFMNVDTAELVRDMRQWAVSYYLDVPWVIESLVVSGLNSALEIAAGGSPTFDLLLAREGQTLVETGEQVLQAHASGAIGPPDDVLQRLMDDWVALSPEIYAPSFKETWDRTEESWPAFKERARLWFFGHLEDSRRHHEWWHAGGMSLEPLPPIHEEWVDYFVRFQVQRETKRHIANHLARVPRTNVITGIRKASQLLGIPERPSMSGR